MNTKKYLTILLFATLTMLVNAADKPQSTLTVAVYDFTADAPSAGYSSKVTALITANLTTETNLVMLERAELTRALSEQAFGISGMVSSDAAAKIGQITGVKILVAGQVMKTEGDHLVIVANIIGTETGRLFADKVEGSEENLMELTSDLSRKIAQTIADQSANFVTPKLEPREDRLNRIVKNLSGTNRPSVSIGIQRYGHPWNEGTVEGELGAVLLKAGFKVVDGNSDRRPDVEITGGGDVLAESSRGGVFSCSYGVDVKIQERKTGNIIGFDRQESTAAAMWAMAAITAAETKTVDDLAERILPLLAK